MTTTMIRSIEATVPSAPDRSMKAPAGQDNPPASTKPFDAFLSDRTAPAQRPDRDDIGEEQANENGGSDLEATVSLASVDGSASPKTARGKASREEGDVTTSKAKLNAKAKGRGGFAETVVDAGTLLVERSTNKNAPQAATDSVISNEEQHQAQTKATMKGAIDDGALKVASPSTETASDVAAPTPEAPAPPQEASTPLAAKVAAPVDVPRAIAQAAPLTPGVALPRAMAAVQSALAQEGVNLRVLNDGARLTLQMQDGTELAVRLMMRDGAVEVRAAGLAASLLEGRGHELKTALSNEGLKLGSFTAGKDFGGTDHGHAESDRGEAQERPQNIADASVTTVSSRVAKRLHNGRSIVA